MELAQDMYANRLAQNSHSDHILYFKQRTRPVPSGYVALATDTISLNIALNRESSKGVNKRSFPLEKHFALIKEQSSRARIVGARWLLECNYNEFP